MPDAPGERPAGTLHLSARHRAVLEALLSEHLPEVEVWAYGSRVNGQSHDGSDLDLVLRGPGLAKIDISRLVDFEEALRESTVPFLVEAHDWARLPESFHREIERNHVKITSAIGGDNGEISTSGWFYHPKFPKHWKRHPLFSLAQWVNGLAFRRIQFSSGGKPVIKIAEIKGGISQQTKFTEQTFDESVRVRYGDLLFSWSGQPDSSIDAFRWRGPDGWLNQHVFRVTPRKNIDTTFFYYLLRYLRPNFVEIARNKQTTGLGHVTKRDLASMEAAVPSPTEQREIAHILGVLDDKIELNRRMNETLEAMAWTLFKSWFVDFEPVRANQEGRDAGLPKDIADLFPDRLVYSSSREIPEGWTTSEIGEEVDTVGGATPSTKEPAYWVEGTHYWATPKDLAALHSPVLLETDRKITDAGVKRISSRILPIGTVLLSSRAPIGYLAIAEIPTAVNQGFIAMICNKRLPKMYVLFWCRANLEYIVAIAGGSTFAEISRKTFRAIPVVVPSAAVLAAYEDVVRPLYDQIVAHTKELALLAQARDLLLPKLMSRAVPVPTSNRHYEVAT